MNKKTIKEAIKDLQEGGRILTEMVTMLRIEVNSMKKELKKNNTFPPSKDGGFH